MIAPHRLAIVAVLTAVVLQLGALWMYYTTYSYAKLHLFILAPLALLYLVPPRPLSNAHPGVRQSGYTIMLVLAVVAVVYCVAGGTVFSIKLVLCLVLPPMEVSLMFRMRSGSGVLITLSWFVCGS